MAAPNDLVRSTLSLIESTGLPYPLGPLLQLFISEALDPALAAQYMKDRLQRGEASSLVDDWSYIIESSKFIPSVCSATGLTAIVTKNGRAPPEPNDTEKHAIARRDGGKCCVTGKVGTLRDPLIVAPILLIPSGWTADKVYLPLLKLATTMEMLTIYLDRPASSTCLVLSLDRLTGIGGYPM